MQKTRFTRAPCSIARSLDVLGDHWAPLIIRECLYDVHRFDELQRTLGIARNMLTRRLNRLIEQGVIERRPYQDNPPRYEYHLTEMGYDAAKLLLAMMSFGEKYFFDDREPIRLYDRRTDDRVRPALVDAETNAPVDPRNLYAGPGPSFPRSKSARRSRFVEYYARHPDGE